MEKRKELVVSAIENGTVIDHIPADKVFQVVKILGLEKVSTPVYFGPRSSTYSRSATARR